MSDTDAGVLRRIRTGWSLFDFCNSFVIINGSLYISQWVTSQGIAEFWYGFSFSLSTIALLLVAPAIGWLADRTGRRVTWLRLQTVLITVCACAITGVVLGWGDGIARAVVVLIFFFFLNFFYQTSLVFYDSMLPRIVSGRATPILSGIGEGLGHFGSIAGIFLMLPVAQKGLDGWLPPSGISTLAPAAILSFTAVMIVLSFMPNTRVSEPVSAGLKERYRQSWEQFRDSTREPVIRRFLLAFYLYGDAILSVQLFIPIYLREVWNLPSEKVALTVLVALVAAGIGAMLAGVLGARFGIRRILVVVLCGWVVGMVLIALAPSFNFFLMVFAPCGLLFGAVWALSRSFVAVAGHRSRMGFYFSLYSVAERFSAIIGPLLWGAVVYLLRGYGTSAHRAAMLAMALLLFGGLLIALRLPEPEAAHGESGGANVTTSEAAAEG